MPTPPPQGPPGNPDATAWASTAAAAQSIERAINTLNQTMAANAKYSEDFSKGFEGAGTNLRVVVALSENIEEAIKGVNSQTQKYLQMVRKSKTWEDQRAAVTAMQEGLEEMAVKYKGMSKHSQIFKLGLQDCKKALSDMQGKSGDMKEDLVEQQKLLKNLTADFDHMAKVVKGIEFKHWERQIHGVSKAFKASGLTKGKMGAYAEKGATLAANMQELKRSRQEDNKLSFLAKRKSVLADVEAQYGTDVSNPERAKALRKAMGVSRLKEKKFMAGEAAGGGAEAFGDLATHGGGIGGNMLSRMAGMAESGAGGIGSLMGKAAPILAILDLIRSGFDKVVEQNKSMEVSLGQGGLFNAQPGSANFGAARTALTPGGYGFSSYGLSFERNLKMAQAVAEGGLSTAELVTGKRGEGSAGEGFMPGSLGQFQQIAAGVGRQAGLSDTQSIQQTIKLLTQYHQTLESSEKFFLQMNKNLRASGISTTKYLGILDDVNNHFDRMNKSMLATSNILSEMSRTGALTGESMQDMLTFLTSGQKTTFGTIGSAIFAAKQDPKMRKWVQDAQFDLLQGMLNDANLGKTMSSIGVTLPTAEELKGMGLAKASAKLDTIQSQIQRSSANSNDKKAALGALDTITQQTFRAIGGQGGVMNYTTAESMYGQNLLNNMGDLFLQVKAMGGMQKFLSGDFSPNDRLKVESIYKNIFGNPDIIQGNEQIRKNAIQAAQGTTQDAMTSDSNAKALVGELMHLQGFKEAFKTKKWFTEAEKNGTHMVDFLSQNFNDLQHWVGMTEENQHHLIKVTANAPAMDFSKEHEQALRSGRAIGLQTQTTANVIANAFSTWFNDIIGLLGKIAAKYLTDDSNPKVTGPIFAGVASKADAALSVYQKQRDDLIAEMSAKDNNELSPEARATDEKKLENIQNKMNDIQKYQSENARNIATTSEANKYQDEILSTTWPSIEEINKMMSAVKDLPGTKVDFAKDTILGFSSAAALSKIPGLTDALNQRALSLSGDSKTGMTLTVNQYYGASYDYANPNNNSASSSGETNTSGKTKVSSAIGHSH